MHGVFFCFVFFLTVCCNSNTGCWIFHICHCFETVQVCDVRWNKGGMREFCQFCLHKSSPLHFFLFFLPFFTRKPVRATHFFFLWYKAIAMRLSASARAYCNKATWWFWFTEKRPGLLLLHSDAESRVCVWEGKEWAGDRGGMNAMHVWEVVLAGFEINDLNMCYSWESSERKVQTKALAVQPCRGHRWRNHKDCETEAVEKTFVIKRKKKHVLFMQNVNFNGEKVSSAAFAWDLKEPSSHARTCRLAAHDTVHLFNRRNDSFYWLLRAARHANQPVAMAACCI